MSRVGKINRALLGFWTFPCFHRLLQESGLVKQLTDQVVIVGSRCFMLTRHILLSA